jgi:hypothetical protein
LLRWCHGNSSWSESRATDATLRWENDVVPDDMVPGTTPSGQADF